MAAVRRLELFGCVSGALFLRYSEREHKARFTAAILMLPCNSIPGNVVHFKFFDGTYCLVLQDPYRASWVCPSCSTWGKKLTLPGLQTVPQCHHHSPASQPLWGTFLVCSQNNPQIHLFASVPILLGTVFCQRWNNVGVAHLSYKHEDLVRE